MPSTTFSIREFDQGANKAMKAACAGPVFTTDRGRPAYVLLTIDDYHALAGQEQDIGTFLAMPDTGDFDLDLPRRRYLPNPAELD